MKMGIYRNITLVVAALLVLSACGGGGGATASGGTGGTGISFGTITDFGSVILNGGRIDDSTATVTLDDNPGSGSHGGLKQGMVVKVSGTFSGNTGTASMIEFRDNLEGVVCAKATSGGITTMRVLGQTVIQNATTIVDNNATINIGDIIEVSGLPDNQERIHASFIEVKNPIDAVIEVKGRIDAVNGSMLTINALEVDFTNADIDNSIPGGQPAVGQFVEVKGTVFTCGATIDMLTATKVELEPQGAGVIPVGARAEIEGFITVGVNQQGVFKIGDQEIATTGSTRFLPEDFDANDLVLGAKVEAEGTLTNGVLTATKISFRQNVKLESDIDSVNGNTFTLAGLPGISITTNSDTEFDVAVTLNAQVRVRGIEGLNNTVLATRIEDRGGSSNAFLQAAVDTKVGSVITVLGIAVDTSLIPDNFPSPDPNFQDVNEQGISRATFLGLVQPGTLVKFKGDLQGSTILWDEAELED